MPQLINIKQVFLAFLLLFNVSLFSQINVQRFEKDLYIDNGSSVHICYKIITTKDSGLCVLGGKSLGFTLTRFDKYGTVLWSYEYSSITDSVLSADDVQNTFDNGFIISGSHAKNYYTSISTIYPLLVRIDALGNPIWSKSYKPMIGGIEYIHELSDSSFAFALSYYIGANYFWALQKTDKFGNILWSKKTVRGFIVKEKTNKHIVMFSNGYDLHLKEFDENGTDVLERAYVDTNSNRYYNAWGHDINVNNEIIMFSDLFGYFTPDENKLYVLKVDSNYNIQFSNSYKSGWSNAQVYSGSFTKDCKIIINGRIGYRDSIGPFYEKQSMLKLDYNGNVDWHKIYNNNLICRSQYVTPTYDYGYASLGEIDEAFPFYAKIVKTDINGETSCRNDSLLRDTITNIPLSIDSTLYPTPFITLSNHNFSVIKTANSYTIATHCEDEKNFPNTINECMPTIKLVEESPDILIPNVFTPNGDGINDSFIVNYKGTENVSYQIYNRWGNIIMNKIKSPIEWNGKTKEGKSYDDGVYFYKIKIGEKDYKGFIQLLK